MAMSLAGFVVLACCAQAPSDYFPSKEGMTWTYVWEDGKVDKVTCEGTQSLDELEYLVYAFDVQDGASQRKEWYYLGEWEGRDGVLYCGTDMDAEEPMDDCRDNPQLLLKTGTKKGDTWEHRDDDRVTKYEHQGEEEVTVPAGTYKAVKVRKSYTLAGDPCTTTTWYVKGVGLVKMEMDTGGAKSTMTLKEVK